MITRRTLSNIVIFAVGAGIGSAVTWYLTKTKYEQILQEEIDSVEKTFSVLNKKAEEEVDDSDIPDEYYDDLSKKHGYVDQDKASYNAIIKSAGYSNNEEDKNVKKPYVIPPEEFGECDYETVSLLYHTDGVVSDEFGEVVEDAEKILGDDFANHYGEYEEDSVFIRNDELETDYEVLKDYRAYSESN